MHRMLNFHINKQFNYPRAMTWVIFQACRPGFLLKMMIVYILHIKFLTIPIQCQLVFKHYIIQNISSCVEEGLTYVGQLGQTLSKIMTVLTKFSDVEK